MKIKILRAGIVCFLFFLFCTVTSFPIEQMMIPQVTTRKPLLVEGDTQQLMSVPVACLAKEEQFGEKCIWLLKKRDGMWGKTEYYVELLSGVIVKQRENELFVKGLNETDLVVEDALRPLTDGGRVRMVQ